jgi:tetraacyldisaccharide 4'-kinase
MFARRRRRSYSEKLNELWKPPVPVVVVGNINVGGTGKSPLVIWLAGQFARAGFSPGIVARGYGGSAPQYPFEVTPVSEPGEAGEEAVMIAKRTGCPVVVDKNRTRAVQTLLLRNDCDIVICDDGLQHYALKRDIEIAVLDGKKGLGNGLCIPAGPLREPPGRLKEVDFVVVNGPESLNLPCAATHMTLAPEAWVNLHTQEELDIAAWSGGEQVHAVAGIGNPNRFFDTLRELGFDVIEHFFEDHQIYHVSDLVFNDKLKVVMTEKDAVKCRLLNRELMHKNYWYLRVSVDMDDQFMKLVMAKLKRNDAVARTVAL